MSPMLSNSKPLSLFIEGFHLRTSSPSLMPLNGSLSVARTFVLLESTGCSWCSWIAESFITKIVPWNTLQKSMCVKRPNLVEIQLKKWVNYRCGRLRPLVHHAREDPSIEFMFHSAPRVRKNKYDESIVLQTSLLSFEIHVSVLPLMHEWWRWPLRRHKVTRLTRALYATNGLKSLYAGVVTPHVKAVQLFVYKMKTARKAGEWN